jgi:BASS family bile acid:Na+ symporter
MAPCAPFLPPMVDRAKGDLGLAAVVMLVTAVVTVIYMPLVAPLAAPGLDASAWTIARPLVFFVLVPLAIGVAIQKTAPDLAARLHPPVKAVTGIDTLAMLVLCAVVYGKGFVSLAGSYAIGAQLLFFAAASIGPYVFGPGLDRDERVVLSLGMTTRNLGAAFAPLFSIHPGIEQAVVTVALGVLMQAAFSFAAATLYARGGPIPTRSPSR